METHINGIKISYDTKGSGSPLLVVHGWGGKKLVFVDLVDTLSSTYTVYSLDLPGFGDSGNPPKEWGVYEYAELVHEFINQMEIKDLIYFGHSFGGSIGIILANKYPTLFSKLVLCAPSFKRSTPARTSLSEKFPIYKNLKSVLRPVRKLAYRILYPNSELMKFSHLESNFEKIVTQDLSEDATQIKTPTLILWGDKDDFADFKNANELHQLINGSILKTYSGEGHGIPFTQYKEIALEITNLESKSNA